jgi:hypothetical protein
MNKRIISIGIVSLLVIGGFIGTFLIIPDTVDAPGPTYISGIISTNTTWTLGDSPYIVTGNVLVEQNVILTIEPGVNVKFDGFYYIRIEGKLLAEGTEKDMINFTSNKGTPTPGDWDALRFMKNGNGSLIKYCRIEYAYQAINVDDNNPVEACPNITYCQIRNIEYVGISYAPRDPVAPTINPTNIIAHNIISTNSQSGIHISILNAHILINENIFENLDYGIHIIGLTGGSISVTNNTFKNNVRGFHGAPRYMNFTNNLVMNNDKGIHIDAMDDVYSTRIANNTIINNSYGIYLEGIIYDFSISYNNLHNNLNYEIMNLGKNDIYAPYNWWGTTNTSEIDTNIYDYYDDFFYGKVLYMPFLTGPVSQKSARLKQGCNLISIPLIQGDESIDKVLSSISGEYDAVQWYDPTDTNDPWKHHKIGKPYGNDLFELNETMGFWIHITQTGDTIFFYNGTQPTSNQIIPLHPGWNLVGYPSLSSHNRTEGLNNLTFDVEVDAIWTFDAATQKWEEIGEGDFFEIGRGYWIHVKTECEWEVPL